ncbi:hypothetical protein, conserved [Trypanosoma brucei brucei TREU927]|uniref:Uncharacterized protein n=1 Tax=Trypanosoma brucei brucei (strain 927/4 GUTat10.1) TaxID=185431 RepID=Q38BQ3_TRYB2|nr:hypothetical protein, conserved [Trypanosoma brucei brucei TREU927]EAN77767.1 hypothetical protein, conserved [Trypanosoma brucei brucei TREU927]
MLSPIVDMKSVGTDDGFDIYLPGSDAFYFKRQLHYQPYTPCAFPVEWLGHQGKMHKTSVHMRISPSNLEEACASGSLGYVIMFWAQGQNIKGCESVVGGGDTLLMTAAYKGHIHVVRFLVDAGADINATNSAGFSALHMAASAINYHIVRFLSTTVLIQQRRTTKGIVRIVLLCRTQVFLFCSCWQNIVPLISMREMKWATHCSIGQHTTILLPYVSTLLRCARWI